MKGYSVVCERRQDFSGEFPGVDPHFIGDLVLENETEFIFKTDSGVIMRFQKRFVVLVMEYEKEE